MMKSHNFQYLSSACVAIGLLTTLFSVAHANVLTFDGPACRDPITNTATTCVDGAEIFQGYGDNPASAINVTYNGSGKFRSQAAGYGDLVDAAYYDATGDSSIGLFVFPGYGLRLNGFDLAGFDFQQNKPVTTRLKIGYFDISAGSVFTTLIDEGTVTLPTSGSHLHFNYALDAIASGPSGFLNLGIQWSNDDRFTVGIDNVDFTLAKIPATTTPEPASLLLMALGLFTLSAWKRKEIGLRASPAKGDKYPCASPGRLIVVQRTNS